MTTEMAPKGRTLLYSIRLLIKHPRADPTEISRNLGLQPDMQQKAGNQRFTPAGRALPGVYKETTWSHSEVTYGDRHFFAGLTRLMSQLELHTGYIRALVESGGRVLLTADLAGGTNIGDEMNWQDLGRLAAMKISLGVEVFPNFGVRGRIRGQCRQLYSRR